MSLLSTCSVMFYETQSQVVLVVKNPPANAGDKKMQAWLMGREDPLEKQMATHSSVLAWKIPWTWEPSGVQYIGS